jgi:competence protein CoiA
MKYALFNGNKIEACKGDIGFCPSCGSELIAKCGEIKINHWAHKGARNCDVWWENETEWHCSWKGQFPIEWQEVVHFDESGEKHIADVKTREEWVIEFQHSYIRPAERRSRNAFYKKISWVVDGLRRKRDMSQFYKVIKEASVISMDKLKITFVEFPDESRLIREWLDSNVPVFFDFTNSNELKYSKLRFLVPNTSNDVAYLIPISRDSFIEIHKKNRIEKITYNIILAIRNYIKYIEQNKQEEMNRRVNYLWSKMNKAKKPRRRF